MRVLEPKELEERRYQRAKQHTVRKHKRRALPLLFVVLAAYIVTVMLVPAPTLQTHAISINVPTGAPASMPWPHYGQAAIGAVGYGLLAQNGDPKPLPIASVAKVLTAVAVLKARPIHVGDQANMITLTAADVATYNKYVSEGQSVIKVTIDEQLTEYQALQALLLPSANNMADVLAVWAFGSMDNYLAFVNPFTKTLGMNTTSVADASGFSPKTTSVAADLTKLAEIAMNQPTIAEIVSQQQADLPVAGTVYNVNKLVGHDGVVGIKTGNTDEAGGCYLFSARRKVDSTHELTVVGTVMGATDLTNAIQDALPLLDEAFKNFHVITPLHANDEVGSISQSGGGSTPLVIGQGKAVVAWANQPIKSELKTAKLTSHIKEGDAAGFLLLEIGDMTYQVPVTANKTIEDPSLLWRLRHAGGYL